MNNKRVYIIMLVMIGLFAAGNAGAVFAGNQILSAKSRKLSDLKLDSNVLSEQQASLTKARKDIETYSDLEKVAKTIVPQDKDQAEAVRAIVKLASDNGIKLASISFPASNLGQVAPKAAPSTDPKAAADTPKVTAIPFTQVKPVDGIPGVFSLEITIQQDTTSPITYEKFISFLVSLEKNRRTSQVTNVTVNPNSADRSKITFTLTVVTYIKP